VNLGIAADTPFSDKEAFLVFLGDNEIAHISYGSALARRGVVVSNVQPTGNPYEHPGWMADHWQLHLEECRTLGVPVPDLSTADLKNEQQYADWMKLHSDLHRLQNAALGIYT